MDMTNQMVAQQLDGLSPQALQTQLSLLIYMKKHDGFNPQATFDGYFQQVAQQQGKGVGGLETVDFHTEPMAEQLVEAFFKQDLVGVKAVMDEKDQTKCDSTPEEEDALIYNRNANWAKLMPQIMADKATFFAVGAGHLPGEKGVLQLLKNAGYMIEGVK